MELLAYLKENILVLDGAMGSMLLARGMSRDERSESWDLTHPEDVKSIHRAYYDAGSNAVLTNTFGANRLYHSDDELREIVFAAVRLAREAAAESGAPQEKFVALDIGPCGRLIEPLGEFNFDEAKSLFAQVAGYGAEAGADFVFVETMYDLGETRAAVQGAREGCGLPVFMSNTYGQAGRLMTGAGPEEVIALGEELGVSAIGMNCSVGPEGMAALGEEYLRLTDLPVIIKPNAGLPEIVDGNAVYKTTPEVFAAAVAALAAKGAKCVGGCCGTTPAHIAALTKALRGGTEE
ncbi:MAG: homocysteine S-methyltransferase family protein [Oscillospiraceae bacterium]|nr:homocysteine S-methyltransferase family protein [Oscillospiraceae bacterium]